MNGKIQFKLQLSQYIYGTRHRDKTRMSVVQPQTLEEVPEYNQGSLNYLCQLLVSALSGYHMAWQ